jgi:ABC-type multidrug transport system fused ATPase/permease subunit
LSGGERQRIALARIFLADTPILILDESTSALDSETEHKLQLALRSAMENRTTIIIAHRLSTVYMADQIAVIDKGKLVELGTHTDLIREGGMYERLWRLQSGGYLPD